MAVKTSFLVSLLFKKVREEGGSCILVPTSNHLAVVDRRSRRWYETKARAYSRRAPVCHYGQEGGCFFEEGCILERGAHLQEYGNCGHSASDIQTRR